MPKEITVVKASGEREPFSEAKLRRSLERAHTSPDVIDTVIAEVESGLREGMRTSEIYSEAFSLLRRLHRPTAARYHLKRALMELGPTGHPFEKLVGELLKSEGFEVGVARIVHGVCVKHEVDVVGTKGDRHIMLECKYHNQSGIKSDVKVALYVQARFEDVERQWQKQPGHAEKFHEAWLVTNTKLTSDAVAYAECVKMRAIGWAYPRDAGLESMIERAHLHPITCLTTLPASLKRELLDRGLVLCKDILRADALLKSVGLNEQKIIREAEEMLQLAHGSG